MPAQTVVYQSYRTTHVPGWITRCMSTARQWAALRGFDYEFLDDEFFARVPAEFRGRTDNKILLSDFARLIVARELLARDHQRVVWIDADVVVFDPQSWILPTDSDFYFCHELWPTLRQNGVALEYRVNNAVMVFSQGNHFLETYIDLCERILRTDAKLKNWHLGVRFLTGLQLVCPLPLLPNIGMFGSNLLEDIYRGPKKLLSAYIRTMAVPLVAANCCASVSGEHSGDFEMTEQVYDAIIDQCIATRGQVLNQYLQATK